MYYFCKHRHKKRRLIDAGAVRFCHIQARNISFSHFFVIQSISGGSFFWFGKFTYAA